MRIVAAAACARGAARQYRRQGEDTISRVCRSAVRLLFKNLKLEGARREIADKIAKEIQSRLGFLVNVGLDYLNLLRSAETFRAARRSAFAWPPRSVPAWWVGCMCSTSPPSACINATTPACSKPQAPARYRQYRDRGGTR